MPSLRLRIHFDPSGSLGPGKIELLEKIVAFGSISAAGRAMGMSYRRAWRLVDRLNATFNQPVVARRVGGNHGGGACLTDLGLFIVSSFRAVESAVAEAAGTQLTALQAQVARPRQTARTNRKRKAAGG